jgi:hypothetical protein
MTAPRRGRTGPVPRANMIRPRRGETTTRVCSCSCPTAWAPSPCRSSAERRHARTSRPSPPSCCGPPQRPYRRWPPIHGAWEAGAGWEACSIPGAATSSPLLTSTRSWPEADARPRAQGCPHAQRASSMARRSPWSAGRRAASPCTRPRSALTSTSTEGPQTGWCTLSPSAVVRPPAALVLRPSCGSPAARTASSHWRMPTSRSRTTMRPRRRSQARRCVPKPFSAVFFRTCCLTDASRGALTAGAVLRTVPGATAPRHCAVSSGLRPCLSHPIHLSLHQGKRGKRRAVPRAAAR